MNFPTADNIRKTAISILIVSGAFYIVFNTPDFRKDHHDRDRAEVLQDRGEANKVKTASLVEMRECYKEAEKMGVATWARACRAYTDQRLNECVINGIPLTACQSKIVYNEDCELPSHKADVVHKYEDDAKQECRMMFQYEMSPYSIGAKLTM